MPPSQQAQMGPAPVKKIVLAGGGSGGHIAPLLPLARALKSNQPSCQVIYIGLKGEQLESLRRNYGVFDQIYRVRAGKFRRYRDQNWLAKLADVKSWALNIRDFFRLIAGSGAAWRLVGKIKPDIVFSKGGYGALPVAAAARLRKIPIITHDSDAVPGLANRIIGRWAKVHATAQAPRIYRNFYPSDSIVQTGVPLDDRIKAVDDRLQAELKAELGVARDSFVLVVAGGGLGSLTINNKILDLAKELLDHDSNVYIFHFSGEAHKRAVSQNYQKNLSQSQLGRVKVIGFSSDYFKYSSAADLVIARAGASTLAELALERRPAIIFPASFLSEAHQSANAKILEIHQAAIVATDELSAKELLGLIMELMANPQRRARLGDNIGSLAIADAADRLAKLILDNA